MSPHCLEIKAITLATLFIAVQSLEPLHRLREHETNGNLFNRLKSIARRHANKHNLERVKNMYNKLTKGMEPKEIKKWLRQDDEPPILEIPDHEEDAVVHFGPDRHATLVEIELKNALKNKKSALLDRPYVEKKGRNDFLVLQPDIFDPFVTVIPNAIYYNIEKKCVNWLDDCSLNGIRARLLRGVQSPFK